MKYCTHCLQPDTRPNIEFLDSGLCPACNYFVKLKEVDWQERYEILEDVLGNYVRWDPMAQHELMVDMHDYRTARFDRTFDMAGKEVFINGDGETSRDFCYIDNAAQMNIVSAMAQNEESKDQVYNCALNDRTSLNDLYKMICDRLIERVEGLQVNRPIYRDFRPGDVRHSLADISKAKRLVGYAPSHRIAEGLDEAMDWYVGSLK